ncbi:MAG: MerR family transcriptional regulator [Clostridia bacterium]|nr:MerR family transcriptional regulator [Clostridia bacterium]
MDNSKYDSLFKIGEVAKMHRISTDTLRYYDEIDLFKADFVDTNGYRYYKPHSLVNLDLILWFRWNGLLIEDIKTIMKEKKLDTTIDKFEAEIEKTSSYIKILEDRIYAFRWYLNSFNAYKIYGLHKCHISDIDERVLFLNESPISPADYAGYELGLKQILSQTEDKDAYFNSLYGAMFKIINGKGVDKDMHAVVVSIRGRERPSIKKISAGRFAVMYTTGYFNKVRDEIPSLLRYIEKNGYEVGGDCYVLKIWENAGEGEHVGELMTVQIPVCGKSVSGKPYQKS